VYSQYPEEILQYDFLLPIRLPEKSGSHRFAGESGEQMLSLISLANDVSPPLCVKTGGPGGHRDEKRGSGISRSSFVSGLAY
jgi:hypothetical protein